MKLKQLESYLGDLEQFSNPKVELEQYPSGPHIASRMLCTVFGIDVDYESLEIASLNAEELENRNSRKQGERTWIFYLQLYKSILLQHVKRAALRDFGAISAEFLSQLHYDEPTLYKFHKKKEMDVAVDLCDLFPKSVGK